MALLLLPAFAFCDTKISALPSTSTLNSGDIIPVVTNPGTSPQNFTITKSNLISTLGVSPGGSNTNVQFNNSGIFAGSPTFTSNGSTVTLGSLGINQISVSTTSASASINFYQPSTGSSSTFAQQYFITPCSDGVTSCYYYPFVLTPPDEPSFYFNSNGNLFAPGYAVNRLSGTFTPNARSSVFDGSLIVGRSFSNTRYTDTQIIGDGNLWVDGGINTSTMTVSTQTVTGEIILKDGTVITSTSTFGGGGGIPGGSSNQLQFNNSGSFGGMSGSTVSGNSLVLSGGVSVSTVIVGTGGTGVNGGGGGFLTNSSLNFGLPYLGGDTYGGFFETLGGVLTNHFSYGVAGHSGGGGGSAYGGYFYASGGAANNYGAFLSATNGTVSNYGLWVDKGQVQIQSSMTVVGTSTFQQGVITSTITANYGTIGSNSSLIPFNSNNSVLQIVGVSTSTSGTTAGLNVSNRAFPTGTTTANYYGTLSQVSLNNNVDSSNASVYGHGSFASNFPLNTTKFVGGELAEATTNSTGTVINLVGVNGVALNSGGALVPNLIGLLAQPYTTSHSTTTKSYGIFVDTGVNDGTSIIGTNYGVWIGSETVGQNNFGIYSLQNNDVFSGTATIGNIVASNMAGSGVQCVQVDNTGKETGTGAACGSGGGGGSSSSLEILAGVRITSPTASLAFGVGFVGTATTASTATITFAANNPTITTLSASSITVTGFGGFTIVSSSAGQMALTEGSSSTIIGTGLGVDSLWADSGSHTLQFNPNNTSTYTVAGTSVTVTPGHALVAGTAAGSYLDGGAITAGVTSVTGTPPINSSGGTTPAISLSVTIGQGETFTGSSVTVAGINGLTITGATTNPLVTISSVPSGVALVSVSSTPASVATDFVLTVSSQNGTTTFAAKYDGDLISSGTTPGMGTCGSSPSVFGTDTAGVITVGSGIVTSCTMNWANTKGSIPVCVMSTNSTAVTGDITTTSTSSVTFGFSATLGGGTINYICIGNKG